MKDRGKVIKGRIDRQADKQNRKDKGKWTLTGCNDLHSSPWMLTVMSFVSDFFSHGFVSRSDFSQVGQQESFLCTICSSSAHTSSLHFMLRFSQKRPPSCFDLHVQDKQELVAGVNCSLICRKKKSARIAID